MVVQRYISIALVPSPGRETKVVIKRYISTACVISITPRSWCNNITVVRRFTIKPHVQNYLDYFIEPNNDVVGDTVRFSS